MNNLMENTQSIEPIIIAYCYLLIDLLKELNKFFMILRLLKKGLPTVLSKVLVHINGDRSLLPLNLGCSRNLFRQH